MQRAAEPHRSLIALSLAGPTLAPLTGILPNPALTPPLGDYDTVGPEDVSTTGLTELTHAADALTPEIFTHTAHHITTVANTLRTATTDLHTALHRILHHSWHGQFADTATTSITAFTTSAHHLADTLDTVADKATTLHHALQATSTGITREAFRMGLTHPGLPSPIGPGYHQAAEHQARSIVNTEYSPAIMRANLTDLDFPTAHHILTTTALTNNHTLDPLTAWNTTHTPTPAPLADPTTAHTRYTTPTVPRQVVGRISGLGKLGTDGFARPW